MSPGLIVNVKGNRFRPPGAGLGRIIDVDLRTTSAMVDFGERYTLPLPISTG